jgi:hypothetical protein
MEMHALQHRGNEAAASYAALTHQMTDLAKTIADRNDVAADVKGSFESLNKDLIALGPKFAQPTRGFGGRGAAPESVVVKIGAAQAGLSGGMWPGEQTMRAYQESKTQAPKAIAELNADLTKAKTVSSALGKYGLVLTVPPAVGTTEPVAAKRASSTKQ